MCFSSFACHISTDICHQANASVFDKVVVDLFLDCLFMIMKLLACVIHPDRPRIWDGRLLLQWPQWTTLMLPLLFYFQLVGKKLSQKIRIKWNKKTTYFEYWVYSSFLNEAQSAVCNLHDIQSVLVTWSLGKALFEMCWFYRALPK